MRVFLDTNILLDIIEDRESFVDASMGVLEVAERAGMNLYIAWHGLATIYFIIRRSRTEVATMEEIDRILAWTEVAPVNEFSAARARGLGFGDFEDAMQCACAENCLADFVVTRNTKDFGKSTIPAISPIEFLDRFGGIEDETPVVW